MIAIRGAASAENSVQSIRENTMSMLNALLTKNNIAPSDIVSLVFSLTKDLTALNPATVARMQCGFTETALFCVQEAVTDGAPDGIIRVLAFAESNRKPVNVYLGKTAQLKHQFESFVKM